MNLHLDYNILQNLEYNIYILEETNKQTTGT